MVQEITSPGSGPGPVRRRRWLRYRFDRPESRILPPEPRRALALLRALELDGNEAGAQALLRLGGVAGRTPDGIVITAAECRAVAEALSQRGYPLTDEGLLRFNQERGFAPVVRIGPDVAAAYARLAAGEEARLFATEDELKRLSVEARRALRILLLIGRDPARLAEVQRRLKVRPRQGVGGVVPVDRTGARRLLDWADEYGISFTNKGLSRLQRHMQIGDVRSSQERLRLIAELLGEWILAEDEPEHDYQRVYATLGERRALLNRRTASMLGRLQTYLGSAPELLRGSYEGDNRDRGAHPHQGGGVVDLAWGDGSPQDWDRAVAVLREAGFAAWFRDREGNPHIHAIAIGDRDLSAAAAWQTKSYFQGRDGRSRSGPDPHGHLEITLPAWVRKYAVRYG